MDQNAATRIKKESPSPSAFKPENSSANGGQDGGEAGEHLSTEESRAMVFLLLLTLVNGKSKIRLWVSLSCSSDELAFGFCLLTSLGCLSGCNVLDWEENRDGKMPLSLIPRFAEHELQEGRKGSAVEAICSAVHHKIDNFFPLAPSCLLRHHHLPLPLPHHHKHYSQRVLSGD